MLQNLYKAVFQWIECNLLYAVIRKEKGSKYQVNDGRGIEDLIEKMILKEIMQVQSMVDERERAAARLHSINAYGADYTWLSLDSQNKRAELRRNVTANVKSLLESDNLQLEDCCALIGEFKVHAEQCTRVIDIYPIFESAVASMLWNKGVHPLSALDLQLAGRSPDLHLDRLDDLVRLSLNPNSTFPASQSTTNAASLPPQFWRPNKVSCETSTNENGEVEFAGNVDEIRTEIRNKDTELFQIM